MLRWNEVSADAQAAALMRPAVSASAEVEEICQTIMANVKEQGDSALLAMAKQFDNRTTPRLLVPSEEINDAVQQLSPELKYAIDTAYANVKRFHQAQLPKDIKLTTQPGVLCELKYQAIEAVGIYVPGGSAPLPSSVIMQGVLAQLSGATTVVLATPVQGDLPINPAILYAAKLCGIKTIVESGGAGAIAAMAYGTDSVPKVNKIFGPGNSFVTMAKQLVAQTIPGMAIAEHGADSQVILLSNSELTITRTEQAIERQLANLSRQDIAAKALANSSLILVDSIEQAFDVSAQYGPEHLILQLADANPYLSKVKNAGSVFVGDYTPESAGDYASGTNHVLPTYGYSATYSSLNLLDFFRTYTVQTITQNGLKNLSKAILPLADAEGLDAHANAVKVRLEAMNNEQ